MVGGFSALALLLAMVGIYGLFAESVAARGPEIGIRMALGATAPRVVRMILSEASGLVALGLVLGLTGAAALHTTMSAFVFGVSTTDPATYGLVSLCLVVAAALACALPARRAAMVDPVVALRDE